MSFPLIHAAARRTPARRAAMLAAVVALTGGVVHGGDCAATWTHTDVPTPQSQGLLYGIDAAADGTTWAVGRFSVQVGPFSYDDQPFATRWTGDAWETSTVPNPATLPVGQRDANFYDVEVIAADDVWAVGTYRTVGLDGFPGYQTLAMHFDGTSWTHVPTPLTPPGGTGGFLYSIDALGPDDIWVAGTRIAPEIPAINTTALLMHYDGSTWTEIPDAPWIQDVHIIEDIRAFPGDIVWCAGHYGQVQGQHPWLARWDGATWTFFEGLPLPPGINALDAIDGTSPDDLWVVGRTTSTLGTFALVLHWDGVTWTWDAPDVTALVSISLMGVGVTPDGTVHVAGVWTNEPSPATPLPLLGSRSPGGRWTILEPVIDGPTSAWYRDLMTDDDCQAWVVGQRQPLLAEAARLDGGAAKPNPDLDGDGAVGPTDLAILLAAWGACDGCPADLDSDDVVGPSDLAVLLGAWNE